jgi:hypothetical protein
MDRITQSGGCRMPLTKDEIAATYRAILGRDLEPGRFAHFERTSETVDDLRAALLRSSEFLKYHYSLLMENRKLELNMAVVKLVFMHIPKTAGTTLITILDSNFQKRMIFPDQLDPLLLRSYPAGYLGGFKLFRGHFPLRALQHIPGPKFIFTMLREPRARILSQYHYHKAKLLNRKDLGDLVHKARLPLKEYLSDPKVRADFHVDNCYVNYLSYLTPEAVRRLGLRGDGSGFRPAEHRLDMLQIAKDHLASFGCVGIVEDFDRSLDLLCHAAKLPRPAEYESRMVTAKLGALEPHAYTSVDLESVDEETNRLLDDLVELDDDLYRYAIDLFNQRYAAYGALDHKPRSSARPLPSAVAVGA